MKEIIELAPRQSKPISFTLSPSSPGTYSVGLDNLTRQFEVVGEVEPVYLYREGVEYVPWVIGSRRNTTRIEKWTTSLFIEARDSRGAHGTWVINTAVDLTYASKVYVEWAGVGEGSHTACLYHLVISGNKMGGPYDDVVREFSRGGWFRTRRQDYLDISDLSGLFYIRVHAEDAEIGNPWQAALRTYGVWLE